MPRFLTGKALATDCSIPTPDWPCCARLSAWVIHFVHFDISEVISELTRGFGISEVISKLTRDYLGVIFLCLICGFGDSCLRVPPKAQNTDDTAISIRLAGLTLGFSRSGNSTSLNVTEDPLPDPPVGSSQSVPGSASAPSAPSRTSLPVWADLPLEIRQSAARLSIRHGLAPRDRIIAAFASGCDARRFVSHCTPYPACGRGFCGDGRIWIVFASSDLGRPTRFAGWSRCAAYCDASRDCYQSFASEAEARAFCVGFGLEDIPDFRATQ